jgi:mannose-1-phosphate guanylyltransferase/mannose-6-phosphate isomerase
MADSATPSIIPVILSGGAGSRLWPLSRRLYPKQLLPLAGEKSMLQETVARVAGDEFGKPIVICNDEQRFLIAEQLRESGVKNATIVLEPVGRNTAPAATIAALLASKTEADAIILLMPSDHVVGDQAAFKAAVAKAAKAAAKGAIVTFGITPSAPETGFGYIQRGEAMEGSDGVFKVARFVEKPDRLRAQSYVDSGDYFWNSGMFVFSASTFLKELERLQPRMQAACFDALTHGHRDMDFLRLGEAAFRSCPSDSIDYAVMEKTPNAAVVPVDMRWNDVGSWQSLWDIAEKGDGGNAIQGDVLCEKVKNSYLRTEGPMLAAIGVEDLVVVATSDAILVSHKNAAQDVKKIVERLETDKRDLHITHKTVYRPWGSYQSIDQGDRFQVKRIVVNPGARLSLQMHHHRAEHWVVVSGTAKVHCDGNEFIIHENESTYIPLGKTHRLENPGKVPLHLIEVQSGSYLGEDDIVRFEDNYGRTVKSPT